ncbi:hypothetical protein [Promicromonospora sukumoe]|uniref:hypothetical protein n=1 Tax=Promicromonospora sukumoe TaxID=88382 RepID=UPI00035D5489|nr:hypothetical protein [Promicromonospora sukumoe]
MTIDELRSELQRRRVPEFAYSIGRDENETYCLVQGPDSWHVYYSERGNRIAERVFASEATACECLVQMVLNDGVVRGWMDEHNR